jgi:hypothetical protein
MVNEFWMFVGNVLANWLSTITGGVIATVILLIEHKFNKNVTWKVLWGFLGFGLFVSCFLSWHDEHHNLQQVIAEKADFAGKLSTCSGHLEAMSVKADILDSQTRNQQSQINTDQTLVASQQSTLNSSQLATNSCLLALGKQGSPSSLITKATPLQFNNIGKDETGREIGVTVIVITTNKTVSPVHGLVSCTKRLDRYVGTDLAVPGSAVMMINNGPDGNGSVRLGMEGASWTPEAPIIVTVLSYTDVGACSVKLD